MPQVEIGHDEDRGLEALARSKASIAWKNTLRGSTEIHGVPGIAVGENGGGQDVALLGARGQAGGGADALDVENDGGHLGVVAQADEFRP